MFLEYNKENTYIDLVNKKNFAYYKLILSKNKFY